MDLAAHLPLMEFEHEGQSLERVVEAADAARECGFAAVSANDHFVFSTPWLDGLTALTAVVERSADMALVTSVALVPLRGPVPLAKALAALDLLSGGRVVAGVGPGSSSRDYDALGVPFEQRWPRFDEAVRILRFLLGSEPAPTQPEFYRLPDAALEPFPPREGGIPVWIGSWGSDAGMRRVARLADGWFASAYNTTPDRFAAARALLSARLVENGKDPDQFPNALATMWTWITDDRSDADRVLTDVLGPLLRRDPQELRDQVCVGAPAQCAELLARYAQAGCRRVHLWPLGDERRQIERVAGDVAPEIQPT
jgi:alkanesulfonate monooxygenase SsuD/methylene tetrahydromethanopterin reductase-like flavin-dependent oxidoreductase (luciferase family)